MSLPNARTSRLPGRFRPIALLSVAGALMAAIVAWAALPANDGPARPASPSAVETSRPGPTGLITYYVTGTGAFIANADGSGERAVSLERHTQGNADPPETFAAPDGSATAFVTRDGLGVWLFVRDGTSTTQVAQLAAFADPALEAAGKAAAAEVDGVPLVVAWAPDSSSLAYGSITGEPWTLHVATLSQGGVRDIRDVTVFGGYVGELRYSPDGKYLAVSTYALGRRDHTVLLLDLATFAVRRLSDGCHIVWSPDSRFIAAHRDPHHRDGASILPVDGGEARTLSSNPEAYPLAWSGS